MSLDRETVASYTLTLEAIGKDFPPFRWDGCCAGWLCGCRGPQERGRGTASFEALYRPEPAVGVSISQPTCTDVPPFHHDFCRQ